MKKELEVVSNLPFLPAKKELQIIANTDGLFAKWNLVQKDVDAWKANPDVKLVCVPRGRGPLAKVVKEEVQKYEGCLYFVSHVKGHFHSSEKVQIFYSCLTN